MTMRDKEEKQKLKKEEEDTHKKTRINSCEVKRNG
ncbi:hypothetical protein HNR36_001963 [Ureibacillus thermosphaericus]|uniref:Uncharacterized protein n=1 Tax=Ureibacillus thermosphaericus TaxID=51173 RepID=A0A840PY01_URETH|nr:hypothetical protein [Ureibacillus thermosphaericus]